MAEQGKSGHLYLVTGLILGILVGVIIGWFIKPVSYIDISPKSLHNDHKAYYLAMIAKAYQADDDIGRAYERTKLMYDPIDIQALRSIQLSVENNPDMASDSHAIQDFLSDLERYAPSITATPVENVDLENTP